MHGRLSKPHSVGISWGELGLAGCQGVLVASLPAGDNGSAWMPLTLKWVGRNPEEHGAQDASWAASQLLGPF